jgi:hypothetical protein
LWEILTNESDLKVILEMGEDALAVLAKAIRDVSFIHFFDLGDQRWPCTDHFTGHSLPFYIGGEEEEAYQRSPED